MSKEADCCGAWCVGEGIRNEPCYGPIECVGEEYTEDDYWWIHACTGHSEWPGLYVKEER